jgi:hypothetical protein
MCGFAEYVAHSPHRPDSARPEAMIAMIRHCGPDRAGIPEVLLFGSEVMTTAKVDQ